jgi:nucleoside-diphosphate kinase
LRLNCLSLLGEGVIGHWLFHIQEEGMFQETLVILKPDALERNLVGAIIDRFERAGLHIIDIRYYRRVNEAILRKHYPDSMAEGLGKKAQLAYPGITDAKAHGLKVLERLRKYFTRSPVIAIRFGGEEAIQTVREVTGYTDPTTAEKGTIRGDFGVDSIAKSTAEWRACENLIHASGNPEEAKSELALWFPE